ncbi:hypothetical protein KBD34_00645 [Patescibacteria group bacterium]|nr:hypothetical protein [Patescibacteria group bacterium]
MLAFEGIYRSGIYLLELKGGPDPPFLALIGITLIANAVGGVIYVLSRKEADVKHPKPEDVALNSLSEEGMRFILFAAGTAFLAGIGQTCGFSLSINWHPWINRFGWPGVWGSAVSSLAFTALHVRRDGRLSGFMPIIPSTIFTLGLIQHGPLAAATLHLVYNAEGQLWIKLAERRERRTAEQSQNST